MDDRLTTAFFVVVGVPASLVGYIFLVELVLRLVPQRRVPRIRPLLWIAPALAFLAVFLIYPTLDTIRRSFMDRLSQNYVGWDNYEYIWTDHGVRGAIINNLLWLVFLTLGAVGIGLLVAVLVDRVRYEPVVKTVIFLPMAISMVGAATIWRFVYYAAPAGQNQIGLLNAGLGVFGIDPVAWLQQSQWHFNSFLLMVVLLWSQVGFSMVLLSAAVKGVPGDTLEAARIDGASERQIFFKVVVPQIKGTIITVYITVLIGVMKVFDIVYVMTNGNFNTNVLGNEFWNQLSTNFNNGAAAAIVVILMIAVIPIMVYQVRHFRAEEANA